LYFLLSKKYLIKKDVCENINNNKLYDGVFMSKFRKIAYNRNEGLNWQMMGQHMGVAAGSAAAATAIVTALPLATAPLIPFTAGAAAIIGGLSAGAWDIGGSLLYKFKANKNKMSWLAGDIETQLSNLYNSLPTELKNSSDGIELAQWTQIYKKYIDENVKSTADVDNMQSGMTKENYKAYVDVWTKWMALYRWSINQMAPQIVKNNPQDPIGAFANWVNTTMKQYEIQPSYKGVSKWILDNFNKIISNIPQQNLTPQQNPTASVNNRMKMASTLDSIGFYKMADIIDKENIRLAAYRFISDKMIKQSFDTLGIEPTDNWKVINSAYRAMTKKYHPDINPKDKDVIIELNNSRDILKQCDQATLDKEYNLSKVVKKCYLNNNKQQNKLLEKQQNKLLKKQQNKLLKKQQNKLPEKRQNKLLEKRQNKLLEKRQNRQLGKRQNKLPERE
jgi:hypothetical protein